MRTITTIIAIAATSYVLLAAVLYVFQESGGPKATHGPYFWGRNGHLFSTVTRLRRYADAIDAEFGPGRRKGCPGHQEIEIGLEAMANKFGWRKLLDTAARMAKED